MVKRKGDSNIDTPLKGKISRYYQQLGGESARGAASATARKFELGGSGGASRVKKYDAQIRDGIASRTRRLSSGRPFGFNDTLELEIDEVFKDDDTITYAEAGAQLGIPKSTLYRYATDDMDFRCLGHTVRPTPSEAQREKRVSMGKDIVAEVGPVKNQFHQDEKYFICNSLRRRRKVRKSDKAGSQKVTHAAHRRHQVQVMFTGACGVGPSGEPVKIHFEWVCKPRTALRKSIYHAKGDVYFESTTVDAKYFEADLREIGKKIRVHYKKIGKGGVRVTLGIDSAGGHGMAIGHGNFDKLKAMMDKEFNIELEQQPGNTPMYNILDLTIWQASQLEVDKMNGSDRHREPELVKVCKKTWLTVPDVKILQAFEMRKDCAQEAIETQGWCPQEGKGRGGAKRVHTDASYAKLRKLLKVPDA